MTTFTTQDRQDADEAAFKALTTVLKALRQKYNNIGDNYMSIELMEAYDLLVTLHDCAALTSKPLNKWLAPKPLTDEKIMEIYYSVWDRPMEIKDIEKADITFARAIERAHGIGE